MVKTTKIDSVTFVGRSGNEYPFRIYVWNTRFKAVPGVYVVAARSVEPGEPASYAPLFVAAADDLSTVLTDHPRNDCFQLYYGNVVGLLQQDDAAARDAIATDLVASLKPPCNAPDAE